MSEYKRTTRRCAPSGLRPELAAELRRHARDRFSVDVDAEALCCCETTSERTRRPGLFGRLLGASGEAVHHTAAIVTPAWLFWATSGEKRGTTALSARLADLETVGDFDSKLVQDTGLEVFGVLTGFRERGSAFIGLGTEEAAQEFKRILREAHSAARGMGKPAPPARQGSDEGGPTAAGRREDAR